MRCTAKFKIDVTVPDKGKDKSIKEDKFLSEVMVFTGTKEEIKKEVSKHIDIVTDKLHELYYGGK